MKIYKLTSSPDALILDNAEYGTDYEEIIDNNFNGKSMRLMWKGATLKSRNKSNLIDFPRYAPGIPIFGIDSKELLEELVGDLVEFLPAEHEDYKLFFVNVTNVIDVIDKDNSVPYITAGTLVRYDEFCFKLDALQRASHHIFKIPELARTFCFVSEEFKTIVEANQLKGLNFLEVWDSEFKKEDELAQQERYDNYLAELEQNKGVEMDWDTAMKLLDEGKAVASAHWKLKKDENKELLVGQLTYDLDYDFAKLIYIPPILLDLKWHEVERGE